MDDRERADESELGVSRKELWRPSFEVVSDAARWVRASEDGVIPPTARYCPYPLWLFEGRSGYDTTVTIPCGSFWCEDCGVTRVREVLRTAHLNFGHCEQIWFSWVTAEAGLAKRLGKRRQRTHAQSLMITRAEGVTFIFATSDLSGFLPPTEGQYLAPMAAYELLRRLALSLPGVVRRDWSRGWPYRELREVKPPSRGKMSRIGNATEEQQEEILKQVHDWIFEQYGVKVRRYERPPQVDEEVLLAKVREEYAAVRFRNRVSGRRGSGWGGEPADGAALEPGESDVATLPYSSAPDVAPYPSADVAVHHKEKGDGEDRDSSAGENRDIAANRDEAGERRDNSQATADDCHAGDRVDHAIDGMAEPVRRIPAKEEPSRQVDERGEPNGS